MNHQRSSSSIKKLSMVVVCNVFLLTSQSALANNTQVVVRSEDAVPGGNGEYQIISSPRINATNEVYFSARLMETSGGEDDDSIIYRIPISYSEDVISTGLKPVVREGDTITAGGRSFEIDDLFALSSSFASKHKSSPAESLGDSGDLALSLPLIPDSGEFGDSIIVVENDGGFDFIAEAGTSVPNGNGEYKEFKFPLTGITNNNVVTFATALNNTENDSEDDTALFQRRANGSIVEMVRKGDNGDFGPLIHFGGVRTNDFGVSVFSGLNDSEDEQKNSGLYMTSGSSFFNIVHEGDLAPVEDPEPLYLDRLTEVQINNQSEVGFTALMRDADGFAVLDGSGLFIADTLSVRKILQEGEETPDGTGIYGDFAGVFSFNYPKPVMNDLGEFVFVVNLVDDAGQKDGLFKASETDVFEIARRDDVYEDGTLRNFTNLDINEDGLIIYKADLFLEEVQDELETYWITDDILVISDGIHSHTVARAGQEYFGKTINEINGSDINNSGLVTYHVRYEDSTTGIHVWLPTIGWRSQANAANWDDVTNWHFGGFPDHFTDVVLDLDQDLELQGPSENTTIKSLVLGGGAGNIQLFLNDGVLSTTEGVTISPSAIVKGLGTLDSSVINNGEVTVSQNDSIRISGETTNNGVMTVNEGGELIFDSSYQGNKTVEGAGTVVFNSDLVLGDEHGVFEIEGNLTFGSESQVELKVDGLARGETYDAFDVQAAVNLSGVLNVKIAENTGLKNGDTFEVIQANQISGEFSEVILPDLQSQGINFQVNTSSTKVEVVVVAESTVVDEPIDSSSGGGAFSLFSVFLLLTARVKRVTGKTSYSDRK